MRIFLIFSVVILLCSSALAKSAPEIPYFASIHAEEANVRTGPSVRYPIQWVYKKQNWPVKVTATFESWRKINDINGEAGWIHESLLTGSRSALVNSNGVQEIYRLPIPTSAVVMIAEKGVIATLIECKSNWCKVNISDGKGWIESKHLWGVNDNESFGN